MPPLVTDELERRIRVAHELTRPCLREVRADPKEARVDDPEQEIVGAHSLAGRDLDRVDDAGDDAVRQSGVGRGAGHVTRDRRRPPTAAVRDEPDDGRDDQPQRPHLEWQRGLDGVEHLGHTVRAQQVLDALRRGDDEPHVTEWDS